MNKENLILKYTKKLEELEAIKEHFIKIKDMDNASVASMEKMRIGEFIEDLEELKEEYTDKQVKKIFTIYSTGKVNSQGTVISVINEESFYKMMKEYFNCTINK